MEERDLQVLRRMGCINFKGDKVGQFVFGIENRVDDQPAEVGLAVFAVVGQLFPKRDFLV